MSTPEQTPNPLPFRIPREFTDEDLALVFHKEVPKLGYLIQVIIAQYVLNYYAHMKESAAKIVPQKEGPPPSEADSHVLKSAEQNPLEFGAIVAAKVLKAENMTQERIIKSLTVGDYARRGLEVYLTEKQNSWGLTLDINTCTASFSLGSHRGRHRNLPSTVIVDLPPKALPSPRDPQRDNDEILEIDSGTPANRRA
jgi:hypothetical protein